MPTGAGSTRIGPYQVVREIGRGGMGVVFFARDARLERDVAIKALPELLARHPERLARFQREARLLASLNHPNIASIYGLEEIDGRSYLILEYIDGETLETMLKRRGALPAEDALQIALQIARAIEAAHERGVIHRDLKPANIKFTSTADVKVLDFGLAKAMDPAASLAGEQVGPRSGEAITQPPPEGDSVATIPGLVLGSPGYLSPEQARGQPADRRTDVFSFGCLLYEMLTGTSLFAGQSIGDSIGATLYKDPDWSLLPSNTPPTIRLLLRRCLQKDPRKRLHDIADARLDLEEAIADPTGSMLSLAAGAYAPPKRWQQRLVPVAAGALLLLLGAAGGWLGSQWSAPAAVPTARTVVRFTLQAPAGTVLANVDSSEMSTLAISPDGNLIAFQLLVEGEARTWVRDVATGEPREIAAARGGTGPFFSPDGKWLGFYSDGRLMKVSLDGGPASLICNAGRPTGRIAWLENGRIAFAGSFGQGLFSVPDAGGQPQQIAATDRETGSAESMAKPILGFGGAVALPDRRSVICPIWYGSTLDDYELVVVNTETGELKRIVSQAATPAVLDSGVLVFLRNATLLAMRIDLDRMEPVGQPVPVLEGVLAESWAGDAQFALSRSGTLAYTPGGRIGENRKLLLIDREGTSSDLQGPDAFIGQLAVSPNGRYVTVSTLRRRLELWVFDLQRKTMSLVNNEGEPYEPVWSPDGMELAFTLEGKSPGVVRKQVFGAAPPQLLIGGSNYYPSHWASDNTLLLSFENWREGSQTDIFALSLGVGSAEPKSLISTSADEGSAYVSPDGKWMLYVSDVSGQPEVYLAAFPFDGRSWQVSVGGAVRPFWDAGGRVCFVDDDDRLMECELVLAEGKEPEIRKPEVLFDLKPTVATSGWGFIAPVGDGSFVAVAPAAWETEPKMIEVIINWGEQIAGRLDANAIRR